MLVEYACVRLPPRACSCGFRQLGDAPPSFDAYAPARCLTGAWQQR